VGLLNGRGEWIFLAQLLENHRYTITYARGCQ